MAASLQSYNEFFISHGITPSVSSLQVAHVLQEFILCEHYAKYIANESLVS